MTEEPLFGDEECTACVTDVDNEPIEIIAPQDSELQNVYTVRIILSPDFPNEFYPESILCRYFTTTGSSAFLPIKYLCQYFNEKFHVSFFRMCLLMLSICLIEHVYFVCYHINLRQLDKMAFSELPFPGKMKGHVRTTEGSCTV